MNYRDTLESFRTQHFDNSELCDFAGNSWKIPDAREKTYILYESQKIKKQYFKRP